MRATATAQIALMTRTRFATAVAVLACALVAAVDRIAGAGATDAPGPYAVGSRSVTVTRANGSTFSAVVRYPAESAGALAPFAAAAMPAPAVTFGHGFVTPVAQYESTLSHLASWGIIAIATTSQGTLFPSHSAFAADIRDCLTFLSQQSGTAGSWLEGAVDSTAFGASGHSMGGGASTLAAAADPRIVAVAHLAAAETNPSAQAAMASVTVPVRVIAGSEDTIVSAASTQQIHNAAPGPRQFALIAGGSHCGFIDSPIIFCDSGSITRTEQLRLTRGLLTDFFLAHLRRDEAQADAVWLGSDPDGVSIERNARTEVVIASPIVSGPAGSPVADTVTVTNTGTVPTAFALSVEPGSGVPIAFATPKTETLAPGAWAAVPFIATVPSAGPQTRAVQIRATRSLDGVMAAATLTVTRTAPAADLTGDGVVNAADLTLLLAAWGRCPSGAPCAADFDGSGAVNGQDLAILVASWTS
jgi:dienelactone hydrolase